MPPRLISLVFLVVSLWGSRCDVFVDAVTVVPSNISVVGSGFNWIENLAFHAGSLWASDLRVGNLLRLDAPGTSGTDSKIASNNYNFTIWVEGLDRILGLTYDPTDEGTVFTVGSFKGQYVALAVDTNSKQNFTVLATTSKCGNGFGLHHRTGLLYTSTEGDFLPKSGEVYQIDPSMARSGRKGGPPAARVVVDGLWAADGLWIDQEQDLLYVGQLIEGNVLVYNISNPKSVTLLGTLTGLPDGSLLDDFTLSADGSRIIGCDWSASKIVSFPAWNSPHQEPLEVLVGSVIRYPTSARYATSQPFGGPQSLYVSEGDSIRQSSHAASIWRIDF